MPHAVDQARNAAYDTQMSYCLAVQPTDYIAMQISNLIGKLGSVLTGDSSGTAAAASAGAPSFSSLMKELTGYASGTASERMEKMMLAKLGVTEEELKKMSPEEREKVMAKVRELIKQEMTAQQQQQQKNSTGNGINLSV
jgi:hypothetical protein